MFEDLRDFIGGLETAGDLVRIREELSPLYEIPGAIREVDKRIGSAVLFERVKGYPIPVVGNLLGRRRRLALAWGVRDEDLTLEYATRRQRPIPPRIVTQAPVKEVVVGKDVRITEVIPVLTHHQRDAGPYFTTAVTMAKDPVTGQRGMGVHRIQVKGDNLLGIFLATPPLSHFFQKAEERGQPLEVAIAIGLDPITFFSSIVWAPEGVDKFEIAGGLAGRPIDLVKAETADLEVPAQAEFILEGRVLPGRRDKEGPFGESTGYYFSFDNPVIQVSLISHRRNPIYHALMPFTQEETVLIDLSWEMDHLKALQAAHPQVRRMHLRSLGEIAIVQIAKESEKDVADVFRALLPSNPFVKVAIVVDTDVDIEDPHEVEWAVATRFRPQCDLTVVDDLPGVMIDPSTQGGERTQDWSLLITRTSKMGIDATKPLGELERYEKVAVPPDVQERVEQVVRKYAGS